MQRLEKCNNSAGKMQLVARDLYFPADSLLSHPRFQATPIVLDTPKAQHVFRNLKSSKPPGAADSLCRNPSGPSSCSSFAPSNSHVGSSWLLRWKGAMEGCIGCIRRLVCLQKGLGFRVWVSHVSQYRERSYFLAPQASRLSLQELFTRFQTAVEQLDTEKDIRKALSEWHRQFIDVGGSVVCRGRKSCRSAMTSSRRGTKLPGLSSSPGP